ncbi:GrpB family protein [Paenibacillus sp. ClWae2A]|nr:GrpB family protein [Paenibacillus sp. ClWae2A]
MDPKIVISEYKEHWALEYQSEKEKIIDALGSKIIGIEHFGSTSIKGMAAKPLIDIMLSVNELTGVETFIEPLAQIGYEYVPKLDFPTRWFFRKGLWRAGTHHLHVYQHNGVEWQQNLMFRNFMQSNLDAANEYMQLKKELSIKFSNDRVSYTEGKDKFIKSIIFEASKNN